MPHKTDGIEFEIHLRPTKDEDGQPCSTLVCSETVPKVLP